MLKAVTETKKIDDILKRYSFQKTYIVGILQEIQKEYNHLPREALTYIAEKLTMPLSQVYSLATFYKAFSLKPRGKYLIAVCVGTACHVRGAPRLVDEIERLLNITPGLTTGDGLFTLETVNCLGCCAIGPVMVINDKYYEQVNVNRVAAILEKYKDGDKKDKKPKRAGGV